MIDPTTTLSCDSWSGAVRIVPRYEEVTILRIELHDKDIGSPRAREGLAVKV